MTRSKAFCTPRMPLALAMTTGFAAQREAAGRGRGGRIGWGMPKTAPAARPPAAEARKSRRDTTSRTVRSRKAEVLGFTRRAGRCQLARGAARFYVPRVTPELSLLVPVFNERENLAPLLREIAAALPAPPYAAVAVHAGSRHGPLAGLRRLRPTAAAP